MVNAHDEYSFCPRIPPETGDEYVDLHLVNNLPFVVGTVKHKDPTQFVLGDWGQTKHTWEVVEVCGEFDAVVRYKGQMFHVRGLSTALLTQLRLNHGVSVGIEVPFAVCEPVVYTTRDGIEQSVLVLDIREGLRKQDAEYSKRPNPQ